jgi:hypothetical protein
MTQKRLLPALLVTLLLAFQTFAQQKQFRVGLQTIQAHLFRCNCDCKGYQSRYTNSK